MKEIYIREVKSEKEAESPAPHMRDECTRGVKERERERSSWPWPSFLRFMCCSVKESSVNGVVGSLDCKACKEPKDDFGHPSDSSNSSGSHATVSSAKTSKRKDRRDSCGQERKLIRWVLIFPLLPLLLLIAPFLRLYIIIRTGERLSLLVKYRSRGKEMRD